MSSSLSSQMSDLVQSMQLCQNIQGLIGRLAGCFSIEPIAEGSEKVQWEYEGSSILHEIREEFIKELRQSTQMSDIIDAIITGPATAKEYWVARRV